MAANRLSIQPVWGTKERKLSNGVLDTAENLMENIDELAEVLDKLTDKYDQVTLVLIDLHFLFINIVIYSNTFTVFNPSPAGTEID